MQRSKKVKEFIVTEMRKAVFAVFYVLTIICSAMLIWYGVNGKKENLQAKGPVVSKWTATEDYFEGRTKYEEIHYEIENEDMALLTAYKEFNTDVVGVIRIPGTVLNHPLVQTSEDEDYYLNHDLAKKYNSHGVPFLSAASEMDREGSNIVIFGHNIHLRTRDVFCDLAYYEDIEYYKEHPVIETISDAGTSKWLIFAYFLVDNADENPFKYSETTEFISQTAFKTYMEEVSKRNWLSVDAGVSFGDTMITLSSCSLELAGSGTNRMVVMAKLLENGEEYEGIVELTEMAENPLLPEKLQERTEKAR